MFQTKTTHGCTIADPTSKSLLPYLSPEAGIFPRILRFLKKLILVTERNPQSTEFFRSTAEIIAERKKQIESKSWIIHPFSTFRLYYEMYMAGIFFLCLIFMPADTAFRSIKDHQYAMMFSLDVFCFIDIYVTFCTGYKSKSNEEVVMAPRKIAKRYMLSIYFISDLVSSLPESLWFPSALNDAISCGAMFKIIRIETFIQYIGRTFYFFKLQGLAYQITKLLLVTLLITHFFTCGVYLLPYLFGEQQTTKSFWPTYFTSFYRGSAIFLGIEYHHEKFRSWKTYLVVLVAYFLGKIIVTFTTVIALNMLKSTYSLETKYFSMMSQVDAYMAAKKIPNAIQKRMREYYLYKYRQKYFKESSIKRFMSDNLKREINYHTCRKLVESVQVFERLTQSVLENILTFLKVEIYLASDVLIQAGTIGDCMYFLASGTVAIYSPSGKEICHLVDGAYFGEIALVMIGQKRTATVIAIEICEVYKLDRKSFKKCLESNKDLFKKIQLEAKRRLKATEEIESTFIKEFSTKF